jgi:hypothetical protein
MECREALELLNDEIDGRLAPADAARLAEHVARCAACASEKRSLASLRATFRAVPKVAAPAEFRAGVMASLPRGRVRSLPRTLGWIVAAAAAIVVAVTLIPSGKVAERDVAGAPAHSAAERRSADAATPPPEIAPPDEAAPAAPPAPGFAAGHARARDDKSAVPPDSRSADEESDKPSGGAKDAEGPVALKEENARKADDATATTLSAAAATPADVRYVVFRDAASAAKFAESLAAVELSAKKYKGPAPAPAPLPAPNDTPPPSTGGGGAGGGESSGGGTGLDAKERPRPTEAERRADLLKESAFKARRVVSRTPLPDGVADADLAARVAAAGGAIVPPADAPKFAELLDAAAPPQDAGAAAQSAPAAKADEDEAKTRSKDRSAPSSGTRKAAARAPVVLVIVVLETPAGGKK